jgi:acyl-coenzyme A synthetase/AMP-(fatty) acid ligase
VDLPAGTACITYTSGTTGQAKGVCLDADTLVSVAGAVLSATASLNPRRHLCLMPLATLLENVAGAYAALLSGAQVALPPLAEIGYTGAAGLDVPTLLACLHRYQPESAILLPQLLLALVSAAEQGQALPASLRFLAVGGGRVGPRLLARAAALGLPVYEGYGLTECASVVCLNRPGASLPGSVGQPLGHARVQVRDGELLVEGPAPSPPATWGTWTRTASCTSPAAARTSSSPPTGATSRPNGWRANWCSTRHSRRPWCSARRGRGTSPSPGRAAPTSRPPRSPLRCAR